MNVIIVLYMMIGIVCYKELMKYSKIKSVWYNHVIRTIVWSLFWPVILFFAEPEDRKKIIKQKEEK